jgi:hypothetical protein
MIGLLASPPETLTVNTDNIPNELKHRKQWVAWAWELRDGKWTKVPINPHTGGKADPTNPQTWGTITDAINAADRRKLPGIGYVFAKDDPYAGVDFDSARDPMTGDLEPAAAAEVARLDSYTEPSPTGRGLHAIVQVDRFPHDRSGNKRGKREAYWHSRFFTFTGRPIRGHRTINNRTDELLAWHAETFPAPAPKPTPQPVQPGASGDMTSVANDNEILERARRSEKFRRLYDGGNFSDYDNDWSDADLGELNHLVRAGADTPEQLDRIHRGGALYRAKWDRDDYRARTLAVALNGHVAPNRSTQRPQFMSNQPSEPGASDDPCADVRDGLATLRTEVAGLRADLAAAIEQRDLSRRRAERAEAENAILKNVKLGAQRTVAAALAGVFTSETPADTRPSMLKTPQACYRVPLARLAEATGLSPDTLSRQTETLATYTMADGTPALYREIITIPGGIDVDTGDVIAPHKELWLGPGTDPAAFGAVLATLNPTQRKQHGGDRSVCLEHPTAGTIRRTRTVEHTRIECATCHVVLCEVTRDLPGEQVTTTPPPIQQDAGLTEEVGDDPESPIPHLAGTTPTTPPRGSVLSGILRHSDLTPERDRRVAAARADNLTRKDAIAPDLDHLLERVTLPGLDASPNDNGAAQWRQ